MLPYYHIIVLIFVLFWLAPILAIKIVRFYNVIENGAITSFVRILQGLVGGLAVVSMSLMKLSSRLDFFFIGYLPGMSLIQTTVY